MAIAIVCAVSMTAPVSYAQRAKPQQRAKPTLLRRAKDLLLGRSKPRVVKQRDPAALLRKRGFGPGRAARISRALDAAKLDSASLSKADFKALRAADSALKSGRISAALRYLDRISLTSEVRVQLEGALAAEHGVTPLHVYRSPHALGPKGQKLEPDHHLDVYHGASGLSPGVVLRQGLPGRGTSLSLEEHALGKPNSAFRGTTVLPVSPNGDSGAALWAGEGGWVFQLRGVASWDVNKHLEGGMRRSGLRISNPVRGEQEHAVLAHVPAERILRYGRVSAHPATGRLVVKEWHDNPHYRPRSKPGSE